MKAKDAIKFLELVDPEVEVSLYFGYIPKTPGGSEPTPQPKWVVNPSYNQKDIIWKH